MTSSELIALCGDAVKPVWPKGCFVHNGALRVGDCGASDAAPLAAPTEETALSLTLSAIRAGLRAKHSVEVEYNPHANAWDVRHFAPHGSMQVSVSAGHPTEAAAVAAAIEWVKGAK